MQDRTIVVLATDARINERLIARGMDPMRGPCLAKSFTKQRASG